MLFSGFIGFSVNRSLLYFLPHDPSNESKYITNATVFSIVSWCIGTIFILTFQTSIKEHTSYDFITKLILYIFFYVNFDFLESYFIANKKTIRVLIYATTRTCIRVFLLITGAFFFRDVNMVIVLLIIAEGLKVIYAMMYCWRKGLIRFPLDKKSIVAQIKYILPLGTAGIVFYFNKDIGKLLVSSQLGPEALAIFVIGCYQIPFVGIIRGAVSDTIFPDMAMSHKISSLGGIELWRKTNVVYCYLVFPLCACCLFFSNDIVRILFTDKYIASVPIFQISLLFLIRHCFEFASPLRAVNYTKPLLIANFISVAFNLPVAYFLLKLYGLIGPMLSFLLADIIVALYSCYFVIKKYNIKLSSILYWNKVIKLSLTVTLCTPILYIPKLISKDSIFFVSTSIVIYFITYLCVCQKLKIEEPKRINAIFIKKAFSFFPKTLRRSWRI
jgi:O-antigen/teichoic acid export membrane protein